MSFNYEFIETSVRQFDDTSKLMDDGSDARSTSARALVPPGADVLLKQKLMRFEILSETATPTTFIPSGVKLTGAPLLWKQSVTGQGVLVGVIDTGIDRNHPDLKGSVIIARDYVRDGLPVTKWHPHGTHVAGTIAAHGRIFGVAPDAKLADYRVLGENGGTNENVTAAIRQAVADGCHIINMSLGSPYDYRPMHDAIKEAVKKNVLVVVAVGNSGDGKPDTIEIEYPGYYHEVVGAAWVDYDEQTGKITSNPHSATSPEVDVCAVGGKVLSCIPGGKYAYFSGTSMASPHVSGFAALMLSKAKLRLGSGAFISEQVLFDMVKTMTVDMETTGIDSLTGAGLVTFYPSLPDKATLDKLMTDETRMTAALNKTCAAPEAIKSAVHSA